MYCKNIGESKWALEAAKYLNASFPSLIYLILMGKSSLFPREEPPHNLWESPGAGMKDAGSPAGHSLAKSEAKSYLTGEEFIQNDLPT